MVETLLQVYLKIYGICVCSNRRFEPTTDGALAMIARATGDSKHAASSHSTFDVLWVLYNHVLNIDPSDPNSQTRDRFVLSKGHGPIAYYAVLCDRGFFPTAWLDGFGSWTSPLGFHPDRSLVPGVEASTGSLGHGLPMAVGVALALRAKLLTTSRVFVLCGDAELNEGTNWEAIMLAAHLQLDLTLIVVDNQSSTISMRPWRQKLEAFGWAVRHAASTDHGALRRALAPTLIGNPLAVIAVVADVDE